MLHNRYLTLRIATKKDFSILIRVLFLLILLSAVLSPQPVALTLIAALLIGTGWISRTLGFSKVDDMETTLSIFADGRVSLSPACGNVVEGCLDGQQWCTQRLSVLRISTGDGVRNLIVLSRQQATDEYRRLNVWLRRNIFSNTDLLLKSEGRVQS